MLSNVSLAVEATVSPLSSDRNDGLHGSQMDLDFSALTNGDLMTVNRVEDQSQDVSNIVSGPNSSLVAPPSLPSFRDMVVGHSTAGQRDALIMSNPVGATRHIKEPSADNRFGPWMQVANRRHRPDILRRAPNQNGPNLASKSGSHFGVLADVVSNGLSTSDLQVLVPTCDGASSSWAATNGVEPSALGEMEVVA
ncbi:hypothetical protein V6N12_058381 [Hibiscus sabdariffa]|uniref:Uncharacterized protein n=1 Tax=Hibiscus sabdariffa TaxID=183260 RepID=A0ABR2ETY0_9ROSI